MKTKYGYLRFIKWEGDNALFKEAEFIDILICGLGLNAIAGLLNMKEYRVLVKSKYLPEKSGEITQADSKESVT